MRRGRIGVFSGSSIGNRRAYAQAAQQVGRCIAGMDWSLVCGGSRIGLTGLVTDAVLAGGGEVFGVIPRSLVNREVAHPCLTSLLVVDSIEERKQVIDRWSDAFLALPGSFGTCEELLDVLTKAQLGMHTKPCGLLNTAGFYDPLILQINRAVSDGFLKPAYRNLLVVDSNPESLLESLTNQKVRVTATAAAR